MLNLKHLYYFHVFAQELSTTRAAKRLGITAPALSNQLKQLEAFVGAPLSIRRGGKVKLAPTGEMLMHYADRMFSAYDDLRHNLKQSPKLRHDRFKVGICQHLGSQFSFDLLSLIVDANLSTAHRVQMTFKSSNQLLKLFAENQLDLIVGGFSTDANVGRDWISQGLSFPVRLFAPLGFVTDAQQRDPQLKLLDPTPIIELANAKRISIVLPAPQSALRHETDRFLLASRVAPERTIECNHSSGIVQLIERGFAAGFAPTPSLLDFKSASSLTVLGPSEGYWQHGISVFIRPGGEISMKNVPRAAAMFREKLAGV